jgi:hypothetical protein
MYVINSLEEVQINFYIFQKSIVQLSDLRKINSKMLRNWEKTYWHLEGGVSAWVSYESKNHGGNLIPVSRTSNSCNSVVLLHLLLY